MVLISPEFGFRFAPASRSREGEPTPRKSLIFPRSFSRVPEPLGFTSVADSKSPNRITTTGPAGVGRRASGRAGEWVRVSAHRNFDKLVNRRTRTKDPPCARSVFVHWPRCNLSDFRLKPSREVSAEFPRVCPIHPPPAVPPVRRHRPRARPTRSFVSDGWRRRRRRRWQLMSNFLYARLRTFLPVSARENVSKTAARPRQCSPDYGD